MSLDVRDVRFDEQSNAYINQWNSRIQAITARTIITNIKDVEDNEDK